MIDEHERYGVILRPISDAVVLQLSREIAEYREGLA